MSSFESPNLLARAESRLASARVVVNRFQTRQTELQLLADRLRKAVPLEDAPVPMARTTAFAGYAEQADELFDFYRAVFDPSAEGVHRPSKDIEHELRVDLSRYVQTLDPLSDDALERELQGVRREWRAARQIGELSARGIFAERLAAQIAVVEGRLHDASTTESAKSLTRLRDFLVTQHDHWLELQGQIRQELTFMYDTQGRDGERQAAHQIAEVDRHFDAALQLLDSLATREEFTPAVPHGPGESLLLRQAQELRVLDRLIERSAETQLAAEQWLDALEQQASSLRVEGASTFEAIEIDNLSVDAEYGALPHYREDQAVAVFVYAHPDDETTAGAEAIAEAHAQGFMVVIVSATGGEAGRVQSRALDTPTGHRNFTDDRFADQQRAAAILGADVLINVGLVDAGMRDEPSQHDLRLAGNNEHILVERLTEIFDTYRPKVIATHPEAEQQEAYNHHDHLLTLQSVKEAVGRHVNAGRSHPELMALAVSVDAGDERATVKLTMSEQSSRRAIDARRAYVNQIPEDSPGSNIDPAPTESWYLVLNPQPAQQMAPEVEQHQPTRAMATPQLGVGLI